MNKNISPGKPLTVVHVITRLLKAGAEENTLATCQDQINRGYDVRLIHGNEYDNTVISKSSDQIQYMADNNMVHPFNIVQDIKAVISIRAIYKRIQPDVVHTHQSKAGVLGRLAAIGLPIVVIHTVHIAPFLNVSAVQTFLYTKAERICARFSHALISVSAGMRNACLDHRIGVPGKHHVIHSGMELERFQSALPPVDWKSSIGGWPNEEKPFTVLMLAAFEPRKRQEVFIQAMAPVLKRNPEMVVIFCGTGARFNNAKALAESLDVNTQLRFLGFSDEPEKIVALADLCTLTSEREGLPRVLVQYTAAGKPVVANHLPGIEEIISDGGNGVVEAADDIDAVCETIENLYLDSQSLSKLASGAKSKDVSQWKVEIMGEKIDRVYRQHLPPS